MNSSQESQKRQFNSVIVVNTVPKRILVVEDDTLNRQLFKDYLVLCNYQVRTLACGCHFFEELARFQPDLILLDLKLPSIDGFALLEQIRASQQWAHIPVIVVSVIANKIQQHYAIGLETNSYFMKPVSARTLSQAIAEKIKDK